MNYAILWYTCDFNPDYAVAMIQEASEKFYGLTNFDRLYWGNAQVTWIDPFLMLNMGNHL